MKIDNLLNDFQSKFGIKSKKPRDLKVISTGYKEIDDAIGIGGIPQGKITEISGASGTGKTLLAYQIIANAQKQGLIVLYIDAEEAFSKIEAKKRGVNIEDLVICTPDSGEIVIETMEFCIKNKLIDLIIIDSLTALPSIKEVENNQGNYKYQSQMIDEFLTKSTFMMDNITLMCLGQIRLNLKEFKYITYFEKFLDYYTSIRIRLSRLKSITKRRKTLGYKIEAKYL